MPEKYLDEIEEILRKSGEAAPVENPRDRPTPPEDSPELQEALRNSPQPGRKQRRRWTTFSPGKIMLGGLAIFLIAAIMGVNLLIWVGLAILVGAYLLFFVKPSYGPMEKRWRGRLVEDPESTVDRFKKWLKR